jgi:prolyl-tRNA editing enzyme YbaK/EbsC (Cys-tRNA(Pro) deacylase)
MQSHELVKQLEVIAPDQLGAHLPAHVVEQLPARGVTVFAVTDDASDTAAFSARYGFGLEDCANTIVVRYKKDGAERYAALVSLGARRLDVNGAVKAALGAQRLSFAKREQAVEHSGMEFGGITAFGLPADWRVLVDAAVLERTQNRNGRRRARGQAAARARRAAAVAALRNRSADAAAGIARSASCALSVLMSLARPKRGGHAVTHAAAARPRHDVTASTVSNPDDFE